MAPGSFNVGLHLTIASVFGGRQPGTSAISWTAPLFTIASTTLSGLMFSQRWPPGWFLRPVLFALGLTSLTYAWRISFGQLQNITRRPTPRADKFTTSPGEPSMPSAPEMLGRMNMRWELLRRRVYGDGRGLPGSVPAPWRTYAALIGGPLDGLLLDITDWTKDEIDNGTALVAERGRFPGGRTLYAPHPAEPRAPAPGVTCCFHHTGDTPRSRGVRSEP